MEFEDWRWRSSARGYGSIVLSDFLNDDILEMNCKILEILYYQLFGILLLILVEWIV